MVCTTDDPGIFEKVIKKFNINLKEKDPNYFSDDAFAAAIFAGNYNVANYIVKYLFENKEVDQNYYNYMKNMIQKKRDYCNTRYLKDTEEQMKDLQELEQYIENETKTKKLAPTKPLLNYENEENGIIRNEFEHENFNPELNELFGNEFENERRNAMENRVEDALMEDIPEEQLENELEDQFENDLENNDIDYYENEPNNELRNEFKNERRNTIENRLEDVSMEEETENEVENELDNELREAHNLATLKSAIDNIYLETNQQKIRQ